MENFEARKAQMEERARIDREREITPEEESQLREEMAQRLEEFAKKYVVSWLDEIPQMAATLRQGGKIDYELSFLDYFIGIFNEMRLPKKQFNTLLLKVFNRSPKIEQALMTEEEIQELG
jgi:hypothetical protein